MTLTYQFGGCLGNEILAQSSLCVPAEHHQNEHQPGCNVLQWPAANGSDRFLQETGQEIDLQYTLQ